jgi:hypothetical protein
VPVQERLSSGGAPPAPGSPRTFAPPVFGRWGVGATLDGRPEAQGGYEGEPFGPSRAYDLRRARAAVRWLAFWGRTADEPRRADEPPRAAEAAAAAPAVLPQGDGITVDTLVLWAERICGMTDVGREAAKELLGIAGQLGSDANSPVQPPPHGATCVLIRNGVVSRSQFEHVLIDLAPPGIAMSSLTSTFGPGEKAVRMHFDSPHEVVFWVEPPDRPSRCAVSASFYGPLTPSSQATQIVLRRSRA